MTNEEAIHNLFVLKLRSRILSDKDAIDLAIKALEQEPCDDAISRADVKKYLSAPDANGDRVIYESDLDLLPPVIPQQKIGRWIMSEDGLCRPICDKCGAHPWKGYIPTTKEATEVFKYCPSCGAKMSESEE